MNRSVYDTELLRALREPVRRFVEQEVIPNAEHRERDGVVPGAMAVGDPRGSRCDHWRTHA